jgi:hypothetical protein
MDAPPTIAQEIGRYLRTGRTDPHCAAWPGGGFTARAKRAHEDLRNALVREVQRLAAGLSHEPLPQADSIALARAKVEPMVHGLFPRTEQGAVLAMLEQAVVFLTSENVVALLLGHGFDASAWTLANMYLASLGADLLSEETTCYVSPDYFVEDDPFADFIVHEAAHVFHNCKRASVGLRETRTKEWLLDIEIRKRETFAYACEAYSRILASAKKPAERLALAADYGSSVRNSEERVDPNEVASIVAEACAVRNGWTVILARCVPTDRPPSALPHSVLRRMS